MKERINQLWELLKDEPDDDIPAALVTLTTILLAGMATDDQWKTAMKEMNSIKHVGG